MFTQDFAPAERLTEKKPDVFSLAGLIAWLEKQPPEREYNFFDCDGTCLLHQYLDAQGHQWPGFGSVAKPDGPYRRLGDIKVGPGPTDDIDLKVASKFPWTYGAALIRARALSLRVGGK